MGAALVALKDRTGSSSQAIAKYMKAEYDLPENFTKMLNRMLKKYAEEGKLVKVKASYKLGSLKNEPKPKKKKVVNKKKVVKKKTTPQRRRPQRRRPLRRRRLSRRSKK